jgi:hypothetical protein
MCSLIYAVYLLLKEVQKNESEAVELCKMKAQHLERQKLQLLTRNLLKELLFLHLLQLTFIKRTSKMVCENGQQILGYIDTFM